MGCSERIGVVLLVACADAGAFKKTSASHTKNELIGAEALWVLWVLRVLDVRAIARRRSPSHAGIYSDVLSVSLKVGKGQLKMARSVRPA